MPFFLNIQKWHTYSDFKVAANIRSYQFVVDVEFLFVYLLVKKELKEDEDGHSSLENQW